MKRSIKLNADNKTLATLKKMISLKKEYRQLVESKIKLSKE